MSSEQALSITCTADPWEWPGRPLLSLPAGCGGLREGKAVHMGKRLEVQAQLRVQAQEWGQQSSQRVWSRLAVPSVEEELAGVGCTALKLVCVGGRG